MEVSALLDRLGPHIGIRFADCTALDEAVARLRKHDPEMGELFEAYLDVDQRIGLLSRCPRVARNLPPGVPASPEYLVKVRQVISQELEALALRRKG